MKNTKKEIVEFFKNNNDLFCDCIEELDDCNGFLGESRYYEMEFLDELFLEKLPTQIIERAFYGYDEDSCSTNSFGEPTYKEFNPTRNYFNFNGYGNLVSTNEKDYTAYLDDYFVEELKKNRKLISTIDDNPELKEMFKNLEG